MSRRYTGYSYDNIVPPGFSLDTTGDWSVMGWVYPDTLAGSGGDLCFLHNDANAGNNAFQSYIGWGYNAGSPVLRFTAGDGSTRVLNRYHNITGALGQWYHMALVYSASANTITAYVDGVQVEQQSITIPWLADFIEVGDFTFGSNVIEVAQVKIWEGAALSVGELADEIAYWTPQSHTSQVKAWWQFDNADQLSDSSGNGNTLVWDEAGSFSTPGPGSQTVPGELAPSEDVIDVSGAFGATAELTAAYAVVHSASGTVAAAGALSSGTQELVLGASGTVAAATALTGAKAVVFGTSGLVAATAALPAVPALEFNVSGNVRAEAALTGTPTLDSTIEVSGNMIAVAALTGTPGRVFVRSGTLSTAANLTGVISQMHAVSGAVSVVAELTLGNPSVVLPVQWRADLVDGPYTEHGAWTSERVSLDS